MSQQGYVAWYTDSSNIDLIAILKRLPTVMGMERAEAVWRGSQHLASDVLPSELYRFYEPGSVLRVDAENAALGDSIEAAIRQSVPEDIRGQFMPNRPFFAVGPGSFVDSSDEQEIEVEYKAIIGCWGYSLPEDTNAMREALRKSPLMHHQEVRLEHVMGSVEQVLYLSF